MMRPIAFLAALLFVGPACADEPKPPPVLVPYRLTPTQHVLVRAKINGKGPFNFILDTGAPALFMVNKVAEKAGVEANRRGLSKVDRFEIEGGVVFEDAQGRVEDLFQIEGMNGMGLAGVELHGVIGYNLLAQYRIQFDFTKDKLAWNKLEFDPPAIARMGGRGGSPGLDALGSMMKFVGALMGIRPNFAVEPRGFLGAELVDDDGNVTVKRLLAEGPAAKAGLRVGDRIARFEKDEVNDVAAFTKRLNELAGGAKVTLTIVRDKQDMPITIELGRGL
jgi:hypothetical protein